MVHWSLLEDVLLIATTDISSMIQYYSQDSWQAVGDLLLGHTACVAVQLGRNEALPCDGTRPPEWFSKSTERISLI